MTIYNFYLFNKFGPCVYYKEWSRDKQAGMSRDEEFKLVYGMLLSLRSFSGKLSTKDGQQLVRNFRTSAYKMNYMETATGLKMVLNTDPDAAGIPELLRTVYQIFVETVLKNPLCDTTREVDSSMFQTKVDELIRSHPCYT
ncbi:trafficking protein particle complex subunit 1 [Aphelenchoides avenae]|nr:trafficking protein particle complex subunit 1 [Aphelenchus avenae]